MPGEAGGVGRKVLGPLRRTGAYSDRRLDTCPAGWTDLPMRYLMRSYYRVMLGKKSTRAEMCLKGGFNGG